jgi:hypothetical protein
LSAKFGTANGTQERRTHLLLVANVNEVLKVGEVLGVEELAVLIIICQQNKIN